MLQIRPYKSNHKFSKYVEKGLGFELFRYKHNPWLLHNMWVKRYSLLHFTSLSNPNNPLKIKPNTSFYNKYYLRKSTLNLAKT